MFYSHIWYTQPDPHVQEVGLGVRPANAIDARSEERADLAPSRGYQGTGPGKDHPWALRSRLQPIRAAAQTIRKYLWGIVNAIVHRATNAKTEGMNFKIQQIKRSACGFRNRERFRNAIYFHLSGLDLYPRGL